MYFKCDIGVSKVSIEYYFLTAKVRTPPDNIIAVLKRKPKKTEGLDKSRQSP